jgi:phosphatidate cytidylyltransferase
MSKANKNMQTRILTALILGPSVIFCIIHGSFAFATLLLAVFLAAVYESVNIITGMNLNKVNNHSGFRHSQESDIIKHSLKLVAIVAMPCISLAYIRYSDKGPFMTIWLFVAIWTFDTFALLAGKTLGGPKLAPITSPNKTWSGFIFGIIASCLASFAIHALFGFKTNIVLFLLISFCIAVLAQFGDLIESKFKRYYKVKDSGSIIPGHGGVLDRMDGFLLAAPFMATIYLISTIISSYTHLPLIIT